LIERSFQGLSIAIETVRIVEELVEIWPNEVCDNLASQSWETSLEMRGREYLFLMVTAFSTQ